MQAIDNTKHAEAHPNREGVESACVGIVTFTWLIWCLVEVHNDSDTCHEEQQEHHPAVFRIIFQLVEQADEAEYQRQEVIFCPGRVLHCSRQVVLVTKSRIINKSDAAYPVAMFYLTLSFGVVLTAHEVPHEITPEHPATLIINEKLKILTESRNHDSLLTAVRTHLGGGTHLRLVNVTLVSACKCFL